MMMTGHCHRVGDSLLCIWTSQGTSETKSIFPWQKSYIIIDHKLLRKWVPNVSMWKRMFYVGILSWSPLKKKNVAFGDDRCNHSCKPQNGESNWTPSPWSCDSLKNTNRICWQNTQRCATSLILSFLSVFSNKYSFLYFPPTWCMIVCGYTTILAFSLLGYVFLRIKTTLLVLPFTHKKMSYGWLESELTYYSRDPIKFYK